MEPGIYTDISNEAYHSGAGISKSGLWTIHEFSPAHYKYGEPTQTNAKDLGEACHLAILQPNEFERRVHRGPEDRRGNKWKDALAACEATGRLLLTESDFDTVLRIRDSVHSNSRLNAIITGGQPLVEASGYWIDDETGSLCRCRPDLYREDLKLIIDLKSARCARTDAFARAVESYGYHAQEAFYTDGWSALGKPVEGFLFLAFEKEAPFAFTLNEIQPEFVDEGRAIMRSALEVYAQCERTGNWPGYDTQVQELTFKRWAYKLTEAPDQEMAA